MRVTILPAPLLGNLLPLAAARESAGIECFVSDLCLYRLSLHILHPVMSEQSIGKMITDRKNWGMTRQEWRFP
jgi:hypothetical protein